MNDISAETVFVRLLCSDWVKTKSSYYLYFLPKACCRRSWKDWKNSHFYDWVELKYFICINLATIFCKSFRLLGYVGGIPYSWVNSICICNITGVKMKCYLIFKVIHPRFIIQMLYWKTVLHNTCIRFPGYYFQLCQQAIIRPFFIKGGPSYTQG